MKIENNNFSFVWDGGVILRLTTKVQREISNKKHVCVSCGDQKLLCFEKISGGQKSYLCEECGRKYAESAKTLQEERKGYFTSS